MQFYQPTGAWALLGAAAIIALYMLRRQFTQITVPSTLLWRRALADRSANRPIQRLKRGILFFLQLIAALLFALCLMQPVTGGVDAAEYVLVFDLSASMSAEGRMEQAIESACRLIGAIPGGGAVTVIAAGSDVAPIITRSTDMARVERTIRSLKAGFSGADLDQAVSLAGAMAREVEGLRIAVYSDEYTAPEGADISVINAERGLDNRTLTSFVLAAKAGRTSGLIRVTNYGAAAKLTVEVYDEGGTLWDVVTLEIEAGSVASASVELPEGTTVARAAIVESDAIAADDECWAVLRENREQIVAFAGNENIFIETALALRADIALVRTNAADLAGVDAALWVLDDGVLALSATGGSGITAGAQVSAAASITAASSEAANRLLAGASLDGVAVRSYRPLTGGSPILMCGGDVIAAYDGESLVFGFDLHDSNLPVKGAFPVLIQNALAELIPESSAVVQDVSCGDAVSAKLSARTADAWVETSAGRRAELPYVPEEPGIYRLMQRMEDGDEHSAAFSARVPQSESDVRSVAPSMSASQSGDVARGGRDWSMTVLVGILALLMAEWWVSRRGI